MRVLCDLFTPELSQASSLLSGRPSCAQFPIFIPNFIVGNFFPPPPSSESLSYLPAPPLCTPLVIPGRTRFNGYYSKILRRKIEANSHIQNIKFGEGFLSFVSLGLKQHVNSKSQHPPETSFCRQNETDSSLKAEKQVYAEGGRKKQRESLSSNKLYSCLPGEGARQQQLDLSC